MQIFQPKFFTTIKTYTKAQFYKDVIAGMIVAIIALPLSIALAIASGVTPEMGLYTAIVAGFLISFLGGSRVQIGGPTGAFMVIVYGIVVEFGIRGLTIATLMAGLMMIVFGLIRLGNVIKYIPYPITSGFTSGIALTIFTSQIKDFLGLETGNLPVEFIGKWEAYVHSISTFKPVTFALGMIALAIIILWPKFNKKIPGTLIALIVTALIVKVFDLDVATIGSKFGAISAGLPKFDFPKITINDIQMLLMPAVTIAILGSIESLLSAVVSDGMTGGKHRSNTELIAQGIANTASALFGGIPATGAIARTVANIKNGGRTPVAGMVHALTLLLMMVFLMPLVKLIPLTSLAAVLIVVAYNMSEWREFVDQFSGPRSDILVLLTTFLITVFVDLVEAIQIGMVLAAFLFMRRMSDVTKVDMDLDASEGDTVSLNPETGLRALNNIQVYEINGPFFFGATDKFVHAMTAIRETTDYLLIRMSNVPVMDATGLKAFKSTLEYCAHKHIKVYVTGVNPQPLDVLKKAKLERLLPMENININEDELTKRMTLKG